MSKVRYEPSNTSLDINVERWQMVIPFDHYQSTLRIESSSRDGCIDLAVKLCRAGILKETHRGVFEMREDK